MPIHEIKAPSIESSINPAPCAQFLIIVPCPSQYGGGSEGQG